MKICFSRLSPYKKFKGVYSNGDIVDLDEKTALEYVNSLLAFEIKDVKDEERAKAIKKQTEMNEIRRLRVLKRSQGKVEDMKKSLNMHATFLNSFKRKER